MSRHHLISAETGDWTLDSSNTWEKKDFPWPCKSVCVYVTWFLAMWKVEKRLIVHPAAAIVRNIHTQMLKTTYTHYFCSFCLGSDGHTVVNPCWDGWDGWDASCRSGLSVSPFSTTSFYDLSFFLGIHLFSMTDILSDSSLIFFCT